MMHRDKVRALKGNKIQLKKYSHCISIIFWVLDIIKRSIKASKLRAFYYSKRTIYLKPLAFIKRDPSGGIQITSPDLPLIRQSGFC